MNDKSISTKLLPVPVPGFTTVLGGVKLSDVISFFSGAEEPPPAGFPRQPKLNFNLDHNVIYPTASTCAVELTLPTKYRVYKEFKQSLNIAFLFHGGFGLS